jgi:3-phytase
MKKSIVHRTFAAIAGAALLVSAGAAQAEVYNVDVSSDDFTLYTDPAGNTLKLGGSSGLFPVPGDTSGRLFYFVTDRGPNGDNPTNAVQKIFPAAYFSPSIVKVQLNDDLTADILEIIPMKKPNGAPVTGWPNSCFSNSEDGRDLFFNVLNDPDGLDVEGLTMDDQGNFWISEEYRPSLCKVAPDGTVLFRLVPAGTVCGSEQIPTYGILPSVYSKRRLNRGMEGVAFAAGKVYGIMQRPLGNPTAGLSQTGRHIRIVSVDVNSWALQQYVYVTESNSAPQNTHASDIYSINAALFLVPERRTDKIFAINLASATDITPLEDSNGRLLADPTKTIEQLAPGQLAGFGIKPVKKAVVVDKTTSLDAALDKVEGITLSGRTIVMCPDNDFNLLGIDIATTPASLILMNPPNMPKIVTTPMPEEIVFPEE